MLSAIGDEREVAMRRWIRREPSEREKWASKHTLAKPAFHIGLPAFDARAAALYGAALPRGVLMPRPMADRAPVNHWMRPSDVLRMRYQPGQVVLGKLAGSALGHLDDRPMVTIAGARAGKTTTVLEPNLYLYPGSMVVLDPKGELARKTAAVRRACGHDVFVLDPFGQSGVASASFNLLAELDPDSGLIIDDVAAITQAIIVDDGDSRSKHWNDSARALLQGIILFTLTLPKPDRTLVTVRQLLSLTHPALLEAVGGTARAGALPPEDDFFVRNRTAVEALTLAMASADDCFDGILSAIGRRFANTPPIERGSIFSTASAQTDFLDSIPLRRMSLRSDFRLEALAGARPTTIYLCLPVGRMESHYRWLRMVVQQACTTLERLGTYPLGKTPILFLMEEFATLGHMDIMERAAAYFPGFGVKLWAVLQDITQLQRYYQNGWETFLGNAGVVQCFANADQATLDYIARRTQDLIVPFELRTAFARDTFGQVLMVEGGAPIAAVRLDHADVEAVRQGVLARAHAAARRPHRISWDG
jgi:type IV secretion system protein VirD4